MAEGKGKNPNKEAVGCAIVIDGQTIITSDFAVVVGGPDGNTNLYYHTDAMTMGLGVHLMLEVFNELYEQCTPELQKEINALLSDNERRGFVFGEDGYHEQN